MSNASRNASIAANLVVAMTTLLIVICCFWMTQYVIHEPEAEIAGIEVLAGDTGTIRQEIRDGLPVIKQNDSVLVSLRLKNATPSSWRSDKIIVDCGHKEYIVHSTVRQTISSESDSDTYGLSYNTPYISCQGAGDMFIKVEMVIRYNLFMKFFPNIVESNRVKAYFIR